LLNFFILATQFGDAGAYSVSAPAAALISVVKNGYPPQEMMRSTKSREAEIRKREEEVEEVAEEEEKATQHPKGASSLAKLSCTERRQLRTLPNIMT